MQKQLAVIIKCCENGYYVAPVGRLEGEVGWVFETMGSLTKKLPEIMQKPFGELDVESENKDKNIKGVKQ
jgi:hypothetical protein